jgi:hypothetical protein
MDLNKLGHPVINFRDGIYWVVDGQHRVYALRQCGFENDVLDCDVYTNLTDSEMADLFLGLDDRRAISPYDKFFISCTAGYVREREIRQMVEDLGLKIQRGRVESGVGCVSALCRVYDKSGLRVLEQALRVLKAAFAADLQAFDAALVEGLGLVFNRYTTHVNEDDMATQLMAVGSGARGVLRRAESQRERTGGQKVQCVAAVVVEIYNRGLGSKSKGRLPSWWKEAE